MANYNSPIYDDEPRIQHGGELSIAEEAAIVRKSIVTALHRCGGGHYGGSLSVVDLLLTLFRRELRISPRVPLHQNRDRLILSKGHAAIALYAVQRRLGLLSHSLDDYSSYGSPLEGHPDMTRLSTVDFSTGSLGQGLSVGVGMALALRHLGRHVWVVLGDGECQEGQIWEAAILAAMCRLDNLHAVVDYNRFQEWGWRREPDGALPSPIAQLPEKWRAFGWNVVVADGHNISDLETKVRLVSTTQGLPSVLIAHTVKGKGFSIFESDPARFHCGVLTDSEYAAILASFDEAVR
jgi:transketolase